MGEFDNTAVIVYPAFTQANVNAHRSNVKRVTDVVKGVVAEFANAVYVPSTMTSNGLYSGDGLHPNDRGMEQRANDLYEAFKPITPLLKNRALSAKANSAFPKV